MKQQMVGICKVCGNVEVRPAPADTAVCWQCYSHNPHLVVEVKLQSAGELLKQVEKHPTFRFEVADVSVIK